MPCGSAVVDSDDVACRCTSFVHTSEPSFTSPLHCCLVSEIYNATHAIHHDSQQRSRDIYSRQQPSQTFVSAHDFNGQKQ